MADISTQPPSEPVTLFYSYAHEDEDLRNQLDKHLSLLQRQGCLSTWHDRAVRAGDNWANEIDTHLEGAQIILLLISADFLASDYCCSVEMQRAFERHSIGEVRVIPIILRSVDWQHDPDLSSIQALPTDGKPVTTWPFPPHYDAAFEDIAKGIREVVEDLPNDQYKPSQRVLAGKGIINQRLQEQRRETCLRLLVSIREFVLIAAELRQVHDNLWVRQRMFLNGWQLAKSIKAQLRSIQDKLALAGSELTLDLDGKAVMDAFVAYIQAQDRYVQELLKPMRNPLTRPFGKTNTTVLDALVKQTNEQLTVLEKVAQDFIQSASRTMR